MFAVFFAYVNTICQTFHSNRLLCYSLLDKDSVLDNFTPLVTKQFSQTFHSILGRTTLVETSWAGVQNFDFAKQNRYVHK